MAKITELYRNGGKWYRAETVVPKKGVSGCIGCAFNQDRADRGFTACDARPCIPSDRTDKRDVIFRLIPEVTSSRFKVFKTRPSVLWLRHPLSQQCIKALPHVSIVDIK